MSEIIAATTASLAHIDLETQERVRQILDAGTAANTRRAYQGDLRYFWAWARMALGLPEAYPVPPAALVRFVTDHLEGLPEHVDAALVEEGAKARHGVHSLATISRRLAALSVAHEAQGLENPVRMPQIRSLLAAARRARARQGQGAKKKLAATLDVLEAMVDTCGDDMRGVRDRALLLFAFASGGRRRSEVAGARVENLTVVPGGYLYRIPWSKTDQKGAGRDVPVLGRAARALTLWLAAASIREGCLFRAIARDGTVAESLSGRGVARIVKSRARKAGLDSSLFAAHSLRSGFVTEAGRKGVSRQEAMAMTGHRSGAVFDGYFQVGELMRSDAAKLTEI
ncbi:site-specific integrase [Desulfolutivibrio sulfodismutans]|uniref:site-specific integrase n=1 Tax=Desulfolutivibrio sulfodismutans TaxID=63561 RepID=UPI001BA6DF55|nr:site-specific integrase [Desulfolutivibrio sulfodismutans]